LLFNNKQNPFKQPKAPAEQPEIPPTPIKHPSYPQDDPIAMNILSLQDLFKL